MPSKNNSKGLRPWQVVLMVGAFFVLFSALLGDGVADSLIFFFVLAPVGLIGAIVGQRFANRRND